ncbi:MAG TPA: DUF3048 domain-containing protein, partial [bacterium]|nr:DUF3048 domain-containing protein [bacterium]
DGVKTSKEAASRHPLAIMVENDINARPQSGLDKASIVYETVYDPAATTRFMAIYGTNGAEKVGPIRSIRTMFVDWAHGFNAYLGHWGGNIDALDKIVSEKSFDLDEFRYPKAYWREGSGVALEHTGYSSTEKLWNQASANGYSAANNFTVYKFKDDPTGEAAAALPAQQTATINFSNASYAVKFEYDKATNSYKRLLAGKPHVDRMSKAQITPKNIAIMTVKRTATKTRINEPGYTMTTIGSGKAQVVIDGKVINGTWKKANPQDREVFYDEAGAEITFNRGQLWICVVAPETQVVIQ